MKAPEPLSTHWHASHSVRGRVTHSSSTGPNGSEVCARCHARRWARPESYSADCGGSIDYDSRITKACPLAAPPKEKP